MKDEPQIILKTESDSLAQPAQSYEFSSADALNWRGSGAQQEGAGDPDLPELLTDGSSLEGLQIYGNVRQFRHSTF